GFGVWTQLKQTNTLLRSQNEQREGQLALEAQQTKDQFELKAVEVVMNTENPEHTLRKARALADLFPGRLPSNFAASSDPHRYASGSAGTVPTPGWRGRAGAGGWTKSPIILGWRRYRRPAGPGTPPKQTDR